MISLPRGIRNNNPGNIRKTRQIWHGEVEPGQDLSFIQFSSMVYGIRCMAVIVGQYIHLHDLITVREIINRWAPPVENDTTAYVDDVAEDMGISPDMPLPTGVQLFPAYLAALIAAISIHENGGSFLSDNDVIVGLVLAGIVTS